MQLFCHGWHLIPVEAGWAAELGRKYITGVLATVFHFIE